MKLDDLDVSPDDYEDDRDRGRRSNPPDATPARRLVLTPASKIDPEPVVWAWEDDGYGRIPAGSVSLFAGREGTGKSSFLIWLAAQITTGSLPGSFRGEPRSVIYLAVEDSWKFTIVPRLIASGADLDLVYRADVVRAIDEETVSLSLPLDNEMLRLAISDGEVAMVALDPLMSAISDTLDTHVNRQVRQALDPLVSIAERTGAIIAGIAHFNKSNGVDASSLITGSGAFKDVARSIFAFAADDDGKVITQTKNNLGHSGLPSLAYRIIEAIVPTAKGDAKVGRLVLDGNSERSVQDILSDQGSTGRDEKTRAEDYLKTALAGGPRRSREVEEEAQQAHSIVKRTLDRARADLKIPAEKCGREWYIALPEHKGDLIEMKERLPGQTPKHAKDARLGNVGKHAKDAKPAFKGDLGNVGILPRTSDASDAHADRDLVYLARRDPSLPDPRPPCDTGDPEHESCWDAMTGRCLLATDGMR